LLSTGSWQQFVAVAGELSFGGSKMSHYDPAWVGLSTGATGANNQTYLTAFTSAVPAGGLIRIAEGTYNVTGLWTLTKAATVKAYGATLNFATVAANQGVRITASDVSWNGGTITGPQKAALTSTQSGIKAYGADVSHKIYNVSIKDTTISNFGYGGIELHFVTDFDIINNDIYDNYYFGIMAFSCVDGLIDHNSVEDIIGDGVVGTNAYGIALTKTSGTSAEYPPCYHIRVTNNYLKGIITWEALDTHGGTEILFSQNQIVDCRSGIVLGPYTSTGGDEIAPLYCKVMGNYMSINHGAGEVITRADSGYGISVSGHAATSDYATYTTVQGNTIFGYGKDTTGSSDCSMLMQISVGTVFKDNLIYNSGAYATKIGEGNTLFLIDGDYVQTINPAVNGAWLSITHTACTGIIQNCRGNVGANYLVISAAASTGIDLYDNHVTTTSVRPYNDITDLGNVDPVAEAKTTWDPASIAGGGVLTTDVTLPGTFAGHFVEIRTSKQLGSFVLSGQSDTGKVTLYLRNPTAGALDLSEGTFYVRTIQY